MVSRYPRVSMVCFQFLRNMPLWVNVHMSLSWGFHTDGQIGGWHATLYTETVSLPPERGPLLHLEETAQR